MIVLVPENALRMTKVAIMAFARLVQAALAHMTMVVRAELIMSAKVVARHAQALETRARVTTSVVTKCVSAVLARRVPQVSLP